MIEIDEASTDVNLFQLARELGLSIEDDWPLEWWVEAISGEDTVDSDDRFRLFFLPNAAFDPDAAPPVEFGLHSIYPSPFNAKTTVRFGVDRIEPVRLQVFDLQGRLIRTLVDDTPRIGWHQVVWDASHMPSGIYVLRLAAPGRNQVAKVALIR